MERRLRKQLIYGISFLGFWVILFSGIYFSLLKPPASCFDGIQNQGEEGVDCGGPCKTVCIPAELLPIQSIGTPLVFYPDTGHASVLLQIQNQNDLWAAKLFSYSVKLYDANGNPIDFYGGSGTSFIYAGEVKSLLLPNLSVSGGGISRVEFTSTNPVWVKAETFPPPNVVIQNSTTRDDANQISVEGNISNKDSIGFSKLIIVSIFYGNFGQPMGSSQTVIDSIAPNETRPFIVAHPSLPGVNLSGTQTFVFVPRS